jgi:ribosomal subunit interface protein
MKLIITTKNVSLNEALRTFVENKIGGLKRFLKDSNNLIEVRVEIGKPSHHHRSGEIFYAEANMKIGKKLLRANSNNYDLRYAIVEVKKQLQTQIKKLKEKRGQ